MKLIKRAAARCDCYGKLDAFSKQQGVLEIGSIVECDCGARYVRSDDQRDGLFWSRIGRLVSM